MLSLSSLLAYRYPREGRLVGPIHTRGIIGFVGIEHGRDVSPLLVHGALMSQLEVVRSG